MPRAYRPSTAAVPPPAAATCGSSVTTAAAGHGRRRHGRRGWLRQAARVPVSDHGARRPLGHRRLWIVCHDGCRRTWPSESRPPGLAPAAQPTLPRVTTAHGSRRATSATATRLWELALPPAPEDDRSVVA